MDGLYLYCIRKTTSMNHEPSVKGIDGKGVVYKHSAGKLEAVVSSVSLDEFSKEAIEKRARDDLDWIKSKAMDHENIMEKMMQINDKKIAIIPMRFGIIIKDKAELNEILNNNYNKFNKILDRIRNKQEWSIKLYMKNSKYIKTAIEKNSEIIINKRMEMSLLSEGMAYFMEEELNNTIINEYNKELDEIKRLVLDRLKKISVESVLNKNLEKKLTGRNEEMILNAALLIHDANINIFEKLINTINLDLQKKGINIEYSGPWPCYNYVGDQN